MPKYEYLFNFSSSYTSGGFIRLLAFLEYFEKAGGAYFILNEKARSIVPISKNNSISFLRVNKFYRLCSEAYYLPKILKKFQVRPKVYYAYGVPLTLACADINWFHVSNMMTVLPNFEELTWVRFFEMKLLQHRIKSSVSKLNYFSGESEFSVQETQKLLKKSNPPISYLFYNGISESVAHYVSNTFEPKTAVTIGAQVYKRFDLLYSLYRELKSQGKVDSLKILGAKTDDHPKEMLQDASIAWLPPMPHESVFKLLGSCQTYLSTSSIENSSTAVIEGLFLCQEVYLSPIPSHLNALKQLQADFDRVNLGGLDYVYSNTRPSLDLLKDNSWGSLIKKWHDHILELLGANNSDAPPTSL